MLKERKKRKRSNTIDEIHRKMRGGRMSGCTESTNNDTIHKLYRKVLNAIKKLRSHFNNSYENER